LKEKIRYARLQWQGTVIRFALPADEEIELAVFNLTGQKMATLVQGAREAGTYTVSWDGRDDDGQTLASGVYLYRLRTGQQQMENRKLLLIR
jgi:flagellar hook assembly protein FlgD